MRFTWPGGPVKAPAATPSIRPASPMFHVKHRKRPERPRGPFCPPWSRPPGLANVSRETSRATAKAARRKRASFRRTRSGSHDQAGRPVRETIRGTRRGRAGWRRPASPVFHVKHRKRPERPRGLFCPLWSRPPGPRLIAGFASRGRAGRSGPRLSHLRSARPVQASSDALP